MKQRVLVTGGTGFAGGVFIQQCNEIYDIVAMVRKEKDRDTLKNKGAKAVIIVDDLMQITKEHLEQIDIVVHFAALATVFAPKEDFYHVNVDGTKYLLDKAQKSHVKTFIYISTESVLFVGNELIQVTEAMPYPLRHKYDYSQTKAIAEEYVLEANTSEFRTIALRPSMIWGPNDSKFIPSVIQSVKDGNFMLIDHGLKPKSTTHIYNLIHGMKLAIEKGKGGSSYFINDGEKNSLKDFLKLILEEKGLIMPTKSIPSWFALMLAYLFEFFFKITKNDKKPPLTEMEVRFFMSEITLEIGKAKQELGYEPIISVKEGIKTL